MEPDKFLLTPLREGRHLANGAVRYGVYISTHAPAGGATEDGHEFPVRRDISTHAPAGGATGHTAEELRRVRISTHAPAGGATVHTAEEMRRVRISTHAPAGGATIPELIEKYGLTQFLLTPLREGRPLH